MNSTAFLYALRLWTILAYDYPASRWGQQFEHISITSILFNIFQEDILHYHVTAYHREGGIALIITHQRF